MCINANQEVVFKRFTTFTFFKQRESPQPDLLGLEQSINIILSINLQPINPVLKCLYLIQKKHMYSLISMCKSLLSLCACVCVSTGLPILQLYSRG